MELTHIRPLLGMRRLSRPPATASLILKNCLCLQTQHSMAKVSDASQGTTWSSRPLMFSPLHTHAGLPSMRKLLQAIAAKAREHIA